MNKKITFRHCKTVPCFSCLLVVFLLLTSLVNPLHVYAIGDNVPTPDFPMGQNDNGFDFQAIIDACNTYGSIYGGYDYYLICADRYLGYYHGSFIVCDAPLYGEITNQLNSFNVYQLSANWYNYEFECGYDGSWANVWQRDWLPQGCISSMYDLNYSYISNFKVWSSNNEDNARLILDFDDSVPPPWELTPPDVPEDPTNDPTQPPTFPTWDDSLTILENLVNIVIWIGNCIVWGFNKVVTTIQNWLKTIKDTIESVIENLFDNLQSFFKPFFDYVKSVFDNVKTFFDDVIALGTIDGVFSVANLLKTLFIPEPDVLAATFLVNDEFGLVTLFTSGYTFISNTILTLYQVTPNYNIHIGSCIYHGQEIGNFDVSFYWFMQYKSYTDIIISAFLILGWVYWIITNASGILRGSSSALNDMKPSDPKE